jgi:Mn-containing catalase
LRSDDPVKARSGARASDDPQHEREAMFLHNKKLMHTVRVDRPNPAYATMLLEQFGGPNGELAAAMRYFTQGWNEPDEQRRSLLLDIATEELSHLEMVAQTLVLLLKGTPGSEIDDVEGGYLGDLLDGKHADYVNLSLTSKGVLLGGGGPKLTDSAGNAWTADWVDTVGHPQVDLRSDIAAEARAKLVYERLIKVSDDPGVRDTLTFLMSRENAHMQMFQAALAAIPDNFPVGNMPGSEELNHYYFAVSDGDPATRGQGHQLVQEHSEYGFQLDPDPLSHASEQQVL